MTFLPIVARELRVAARKTSTYMFRTGAAALVLVLCIWILGVTRYRTPMETAEILFAVTTGAATLFAGVAGMRFTADCLSQEKRDGTLGLLFLTDLRGGDVVLGKLAASSVDAFYGILAVIPIMALPMLMGGVAPLEFMRMAVVAVNTLFFSLAAGVMASSFSRSAQLSNGLTLLVLLFFAALTPALGLCVSINTSAPVHPLFLITSPGYTYSHAFESVYARGKEWFWVSVGAIHGLAWVFLGLASWATPRSWQDRSSNGKTRGPGWQRLMAGPASGGVAYRKALLEVNPYYWLAARVPRQKYLLWGTLALMGVGWLAGWAKWKQDWLTIPTFFITGGVLNLTLRFWFASEACRQVAQDRHTGAIELLLSTPLEPPEMVRGQILALRRMFTGPLVAVLLLETVFMAASARDVSTADRSEVVSVWLGMMVMLVADLVTLPWVSMWFGLTARQVNQASGKSLSWVLVFPWLLFGGMIFLASMSDMRGMNFSIAFGMWLGLGLLTDFVLIGWARLKLETEFREAAAQRFAPTKSLFERLVGR